MFMCNGLIEFKVTAWVVEQHELPRPLRFTGVTIELFLDTDLGFREIIELARVCRELCVAAFADSENRNFFGPFYDPEFAPKHNRSLAHAAGRT
jgi:hypothetical protein